MIWKLYYNSRSLRFFSRRSSRFDSPRSLLFDCCLFDVLAKFGYNELDFRSKSLCDVPKLLRLLVRVLSVLVLGVLLKQWKKKETNLIILFFVPLKSIVSFVLFLSYLNKSIEIEKIKMNIKNVNEREKCSILLIRLYWIYFQNKKKKISFFFFLIF